jgi:hypothetical protein
VVLASETMGFLLLQPRLDYEVKTKKDSVNFAQNTDTKRFKP